MVFLQYVFFVFLLFQIIKFTPFVLTAKANGKH